jgi:quercetin dioxygenase-like cupin family protein
MHYTRIYSDENGESSFENVEVKLTDEGPLGALSEVFTAKAVQFRENSADYYWDFHNPPARQFIILLDGEIEITTSLGEKRKFSSGDILLVEDIKGKGHRTENIKKEKRKSVFIQL